MTKQIAFLFFFSCLLAGGAFAQTKSGAVNDANILCDRIAEIKELPNYSETGVDAIYDEFAKAGDTLIPCLIGKITDTTIMPDPRCPRISEETKVGDVAYFVLVRLTKTDFAEMLPAPVQKKFKTGGVYAYHEYIERKGKRKELQSKFRQWYRQKYGKAA